MEPGIRRAEERDIDALAEMYVELHNFHATAIPSRLRIVGGVDDRLVRGIRKILADPSAAILIASVGDSVVGFAEVYIREAEKDSVIVQRRYAHLQSLAVSPAYRRQGLGRELVRAAHRWAREQGVIEIEVDIWEFPGGPLGFYDKLGYVTQRRRMVRRL
jgi:ribosomal protein S18 acetylase RimI-like enzyme